VFDPTNPVDLAAVRQRLTAGRLRPYDASVGGCPRASLTLYEWNTRMSAAFFVPLQGFEVVLRNALSDALCAWHASRSLAGEWYDDPANIFGSESRENIEQAKRRILRRGRVLDPGRVVTELSLGFWRHLLGARYEQDLWTPALRHAFPGLRPQRRRDVADPVSRLHLLRNRIAHHEPIHDGDLAADYRGLLFVASAICPRTRAWIERTSAVPVVLNQRPN